MLLIHTALHAEANALIRHFRLKRPHDDHAFACFMADDIWLVESGIGKVNAAAAVAWLSARAQAENPIENPIWLNIGIAGHASMAVGRLVRASCIEDNATRQRWYPPSLADSTLDSCHLLSLDQEVSGYPDNTMIDMEASGFINAANRFTTLELIQSLKVISDNHENPARRFKKQEVDDWITCHLESISRYADQLQQLREEILDTTDTENQALLV